MDELETLPRYTMTSPEDWEPAKFWDDESLINPLCSSDVLAADMTQDEAMEAEPKDTKIVVETVDEDSDNGETMDAVIIEYLSETMFEEDDESGIPDDILKMVDSIDKELTEACDMSSLSEVIKEIQMDNNDDDDSSFNDVPELMKRQGDSSSCSSSTDSTFEPIEPRQTARTMRQNVKAKAHKKHTSTVRTRKHKNGRSMKRTMTQIPREIHIPMTNATKEVKACSILLDDYELQPTPEEHNEKELNFFDAESKPAIDETCKVPAMTI